MTTIYAKYRTMLEEKDLINKLENSKIFSKDDIKTMRDGISQHETSLLAYKKMLVSKFKSAYAATSPANKR
jgi:hypothetical protein